MRDMDREPSADVSTDTLPSGSELRGPVLDVVRALIADNDGDAILEIVRKLVTENADMSRRLARIAARFKKSEKVGKAQLVLFIDALQQCYPDASRHAAARPPKSGAASSTVTA